MTDRNKKIFIVLIAIMIPIVTIINSFFTVGGFFAYFYKATRDIFVIGVTGTLAFYNLKIYFSDKKSNFYCLIIANLLLTVITIHTLRLIFNGLLC